MGYAEAIEQQMRWLNHYATTTGFVELRIMLEHSHGAQSLLNHGRQSLDEMTTTLRDGLCWNLSTASPFYVGPAICPVIGAASADLARIDRVTINAVDMPAPSGFCLFAEPIVLPVHVPTGEERDLVALSWLLLVQRADGKYDPAPTPNDATHLHVYPWVRMPSSRHTGKYWIGSFFQLPLGSMDRPEPHPFGRNSPRLWAITGVFVTLCEFMRQKILTTTARPIQNRQARRRIARRLQHEPIVKVVELRRREHAQHDESHETHTEWSCQWLVRGHWRQQYFPSTSENRPIWITPYVKGPSDKPLRTPRTVAYEVVR